MSRTTQLTTTSAQRYIHHEGTNAEVFYPRDRESRQARDADEHRTLRPTVSARALRTDHELTGGLLETLTINLLKYCQSVQLIGSPLPAMFPSPRFFT